MKTIWHNGTIYTMANEHETVEAVITEEGKITHIGTYQDLSVLADEAIDLNQAVMYPGLIDNHMHMIGHGERLRSLDLSYVTSAEELLEKLQGATKHLQDGEWLVGEGWDENLFTVPEVPSLALLDEILDHPILLKRTCRHAVLVNSKALRLAGITAQTPDPPNGEIVCDENGEPTGYLLEGAQDLVGQLLAEPSEEELTKSLQVSVSHLLSVGLTGAVTDDLGYYGSYHAPLQAFKNVIGHDLLFRAHLLRRSTVFEQLMEEEATYNEPWITPGEMKFFIDGALGGKSALLREPYADDPSTKGIAVHTDEEIEQLVKLARRYDEAVAVHVIGDGAVEKILDVLEKYPVPYGKRDRLIHVNVLSDDLVERMERLAVVLDIQPIFVSSDFPWVMERLGPKRLDWAYAWKRLIDKGFICGGGSDAPVEEVDPLLGIYAAITRKKENEQHDGYLPEEKLTRYEAVHLFTAGSAATIGLAQQRGQIQVGFDADFTIFDHDLFTVPIERLVDTKVLRTVVAGKTMYQNETY